MTLEAVRAGEIGPEELRATPETLRRQSAVALAAGRTQLADNLARAAELADVPSETILEIYTALRPHRSTAAELEAWAARLESRARGAAHGGVRAGGGRGVCRARDCWGPVSARRSERFVSREQRELRRELLISPYPELGLVAMDGPNDPEPGLEVEDGARGGDGRAPRRGLRRHRPLRRALRPRPRRRRGGGGALRRGDRAPARRRRRPARRPRAAVARPDAGTARARRLAPRPGRADVRAEEAARAAGSGQPGARHEPEGEPGPAGRRRRRGGRARLRRGRDHRRRLALRAAERDRDPGRLADRPARGDDAVRGRGAAQPPARDPGARHLRGDAVGVRDRAGVRGRRRHAVVEGVPRLGVRLARREGAVHVAAAARRR